MADLGEDPGGTAPLILAKKRRNDWIASNAKISQISFSSVPI